MKLRLFALLAAPTALRAASASWNNHGTDMNTASDWSSGNVPTIGSTILFNGTESTQPNLSADMSVLAVQFRSAGWNMTASLGASLTIGSEILVTTGTTNISAPIILGSNAVETIAETNVSLVFGGTISSSVGTTFTLTSLTYTGASFTLNGANTYTGTTQWGGTASSTTIIGSSTAFGRSTLNFGDIAPQLTAGIDLTGTNKIANDIVFSQTGSNQLTFNTSAGKSFEFSGAVNLNGLATTLQNAGAGTTSLDGVISNDGGHGVTLTSDANGGFVLTGQNTYAGSTSIQGNVSVSSMGNSGSAGNLGENGTINLNSGALNYTGAGETTDRTINYTGSVASLNANGTGALTLASVSSAANTGTQTLTLGGSYTGANTITGGITGAEINLIKSGSSSWTLGGANTFGQGATINAGSLTISSPNGLVGTAGTILVAGGELNLAASMTSGSALTLNSGDLLLGSSHLTLGGNSLTLNGGVLHVTLGSSFGEIIGTGALSAAAGSLSLDTSGAGFNYNSTYQVLNGFGSTDLSSLNITGYDTADYAAHLDNTGDLSFTPNDLSAVPEPSTYALIAGLAALGVAAYRRSRVAVSMPDKSDEVGWY